MKCERSYLDFERSHGINQYPAFFCILVNGLKEVERPFWTVLFTRHCLPTGRLHEMVNKMNVVLLRIVGELQVFLKG